MENSPCAQLDAREYIKDTELGRDDNKEVRRHDGVGVIPNKGQPTLLRIGVAVRAWRVQVLLHGPRRDLDSELKHQFINDPFLSPAGVLS
jgi:hypothetical protein